jgi:hypothetical protein
VVLILLAVLLLLAVAVKAATARDSSAEDGTFGTRMRQARAGWRQRRELARRRCLPRRPPCDEPPPGLAPLHDSPRAVRAEVARGLFDLESWLAEQNRRDRA